MATAPSTIETDVNAALNVLSTVLTLADPALGATVLAISKILAGVAVAEPAALALINQISSGTPATLADMKAAFAAYDATDDQFKADLAADIAAKG